MGIDAKRDLGSLEIGRGSAVTKKTSVSTHGKTTFRLRFETIKKLRDTAHKMSKPHKRVWQGSILELGVNLVCDDILKNGIDSNYYAMLEPYDPAPAIQKGKEEGKPINQNILDSI